MSIVVLASGGLDSTLLSVLAVEEGQAVYPLFVDYGQRAAAREWAACQAVYRKLRLPRPKQVRVPGYGRLVRSGLTDATRDLVKEAFTPGRNGLLLMLGASYAFCVGARAVAIGLLDETVSIFPDQTSRFLASMQGAIQEAMGVEITLSAPLQKVGKQAVAAMASERGVVGTYSCHAGTERPCGRCISCREVLSVPAPDRGGRHGRRIRRSS